MGGGGIVCSAMKVLLIMREKKCHNMRAVERGVFMILLFYLISLFVFP